MSAYSIHEYAQQNGIDPTRLLEACIREQEREGHDYGVGRRSIPSGSVWLADEYHPLEIIERVASELEDDDEVLAGDPDSTASCVPDPGDHDSD